MNWKNKKVLVTGSDGFIGSHLVEELLRRGADVRAFVYYNSFNHWGWLDTLPGSMRKKIQVFSGDIRDPNGVMEAVKGMDTVFHLAALIGIPFSYNSPDSYVDTNIKGTLNVLQAARNWSIRKLVHTSTSEVYGTAQTIPIDEKHSLRGQSPYSASKIGADKIVESFYHAYALPVVTLRPFNAYGPRQSARAVIPTIVTQLLAGDVLRLGNVQPTRDFNYVANTVDGFILAAEKKEAIGRTINIGSGAEITIAELARKIGELFGKTVTIESQQQRIRPEDSEVGRLLADNSKARMILGWRPIVSFEKGLSQTVEWIQSHLDQFRTGIYTI